MDFPLPAPDSWGIFVKRLNRFAGVALIEGREASVHIHDPGRLRELLFPGAKIWARRKSGGKTDFYLTAVELDDELVLVDSSIHNKVAAWLVEGGLLFRGYVVEKREPVFGGGRFDLLLRSPGGRPALVEVKGVTLEESGRALFPDAPTARGARHMEELARAAAEGYEAHVVFLVFRKRAEVMSPNWRMDRRFAESLVRARGAGVEIHAVKLEMYKWGLRYVGELPVVLTPS
ncbi:DNA/RNA nuclease SfsA [Pyrobaculum ferrireducens]|nr:DNA/RNA nuclease SfsA [Pyrobaculum ferrireducens]